MVLKNELNGLTSSVSNSFNEKIRPLRTQSDWISSNPIEVDNFIKDPYSGFNVSNQLLYQNSLLYATYITIKKYENVKSCHAYIISFQDMTIL